MATSGRSVSLLYKNKTRGQLYVKQCVVDPPSGDDSVLITQTPGVDSYVYFASVASVGFFFTRIKADSKLNRIRVLWRCKVDAEVPSHM